MICHQFCVLFFSDQAQFESKISVLHLNRISDRFVITENINWHKTWVTLSKHTEKETDFPRLYFTDCICVCDMYTHTYAHTYIWNVIQTWLVCLSWSIYLCFQPCFYRDGLFPHYSTTVFLGNLFLSKLPPITPKAKLCRQVIAQNFIKLPFSLTWESLVPNAEQIIY